MTSPALPKIYRSAFAEAYFWTLLEINKYLGGHQMALFAYKGGHLTGIIPWLVDQRGHGFSHNFIPHSLNSDDLLCSVPLTPLSKCPIFIFVTSLSLFYVHDYKFCLGWENCKFSACVRAWHVTSDTIQQCIYCAYYMSIKYIYTHTHIHTHIHTQYFYIII